MNRTALQLIIACLFGRKYYANIINPRGTSKCELSCFIFATREEADRHRRTIDETLSFSFIETVSFRSRKVLIIDSKS